ncbi:MAG: helix-turn-helix domain-containing protein [Novosphingobium sp.]|nr:helix-turn-helix domain-containing protein [Novosphingobium sp.]
MKTSVAEREHDDRVSPRRLSLIDPFDLVGLRKTPGAFLAGMYEELGRPGWFLRNTALASSGNVPKSITVRDSLTIIGNLKDNSSTSPYFLDFAVAGVPLYYGGLDLGMRYAPDVYAALSLLVKYASGRPGYHRHRLIREDDRRVLELVPMTDLGAGRSFVVETPLLFLFQMASRHTARPAREAIVEVTHGVPEYIEKLRSVMQCEIRFGAERDAISFPVPFCQKPSITYDADLWRTAKLRCREEVSNRREQEEIARLRTIVTDSLVEHGRVPRLAQTAGELGISSRTLIRRLRSEDTTYQGVVDEILQHQSSVLLSDPNLSIVRVAEELGFPDASGFHRSFRRWFGMTPTQFRQVLATT